MNIKSFNEKIFLIFFGIIFFHFFIFCTTRDATAGVIPDTGNPTDPVCNPRSFIDLGNGIISDNITGLMWQKDTASEKYNWRRARVYCSSLNLGGYADWRLPTIFELSTLVDAGVSLPGPAIDTGSFPDTDASNYWSSTPTVHGLFNAWHADFSTGYVSYSNRWGKNYVRAVRGTLLKNNFIDNEDGTITDISTGLIWEQANSGKTYTWSQAKDYCENLTLGGKNDWRLPTKNELQSIVNYIRFRPSISMSYFPKLIMSYFPGTAAASYWTSTESANSPDSAWYVRFDYGSVYYIDKMYYNFVRAVRTDQCAIASQQ